jgi:hypothetical protein
MVRGSAFNAPGCLRSATKDSHIKRCGDLELLWRKILENPEILSDFRFVLSDQFGSNRGQDFKIFQD